jgi:uncharacterized protein (TIRG00374 family)
MKRILLLMAGAILSVALIYLLVGRDIDAIWDDLGKANYIYTLPTLVLIFLSIFMRALRWRVLLNGQISLRHSFHINNIGFFMTGVIPLRVGDLARAWIVTQLDPPVPGFMALSTIVIERLLDVLAILAMFGLMLVLIDLPAEVTSMGIFMSAAAAVAAGTLIVLAARPYWAFRMLDWFQGWIPLLRKPQWRAALENFIRGIQVMGNPRTAATAVLWTVVGWLLDILTAYVILFMMFDSPTLTAAVSMIILAGLSVALPTLPGNLGPFEGAIVGGIWIGGMIDKLTPPDNAPAVVVAVTLHILTLGMYILLGLIGLSVERMSLRQVTRDAQTLNHVSDS